MAGIATNTRKEEIEVPCRRVACTAADGKIGLSVAVCEQSGGDTLFVWCFDPNHGPHGIQIPIGRVVDALHRLIDAEFAIQHPERKA